MTAIPLLSNRMNFDVLPEKEIKSQIIELAIFSSQNPVQQRNELALVCKEWCQISGSDGVALQMLSSGYKVKEVILKDWSRSEAVLVKAWSALFQEKFDLVNDDSHEFNMVWDDEEEEIKQATHQTNIQEFMQWLETLEAPYRALIRSADFSKKHLTYQQCFEIIKKLPELTYLAFDGLGYENRIEDEHVGAFFSHCPKLEEISIANTSLSEKGFSELFSVCPSINAFHLAHSFCRSLNLFEILPSGIVTLTLQPTTHISSEGFVDFFKRATNLKMLDLSGCKDLTEEDWHAFTLYFVCS